MTKTMKIIDAINKYDGHIQKGRCCYYIQLNLPDKGSCIYIYYYPFVRQLGEDYPDDVEKHMLNSNINIEF